MIIKYMLVNMLGSIWGSVGEGRELPKVYGFILHKRAQEKC